MAGLVFRTVLLAPSQESRVTLVLLYPHWEMTKPGIMPSSFWRSSALRGFPCPSSRAGSYMDMHGPLCVSAASVCQPFSACGIDASTVSQWPLDSSGWNLCESGENLNRDGLQRGPCCRRHNPSSAHLSLWLQTLTSLTWRVMSLMTTSLWSGWQNTR